MKKSYRNELGKYEVDLWDENVKKRVFSRSFDTLREAREFIARMNKLGGEYQLRDQ